MNNGDTSHAHSGRVCPDCGAHCEVDDLFCPCGHKFNEHDPVVLFNLDGSIVGAPPASEGDAVAAPVQPAPAAGAPPVNAHAVVAQDAQAAAPANPLGSSTDSGALCSAEVKIDLEPRPLRPSDAVPPSEADATYVLDGENMPLGRLSSVIPVVGDDTVSRIHGRFLRKPEGGYRFQCESNNFTEFNGVEIAKGAVQYLKDGDRIKIGDFYLIVYHEDSV